MNGVHVEMDSFIKSLEAVCLPPVFPAFALDMEIESDEDIDLSIQEFERQPEDDDESDADDSDHYLYDFMELQVCNRE
jgi:hypothetical protein